MSTGTPSSGGYSTPSRPLGVAILAVLIGLFAILWIVVGGLILAGASVHGYESYGANPAIFHQTGIIAGAIVLIFGLIVLGVALGLWHLRLWALALAILILLVDLVLDVLSGSIVTLGFVVALLLFIYLLAVHRHFR